MRSRRSEAGYTLMELIIVVFMLMVIPATILIIYLGGSLITSGIKASTQQCGTELGAEAVFNGDWFCPEE